MPALPLHEAGKYVAAAYIVVFALVLIYVAIMAIRLSRVERDLKDLLEPPERPAEPIVRPLDVGRPQHETRETTPA